jgi:hypothetical protein
VIYLKNIKFPVYPLSKSVEVLYEDTKLIARTNTSDLIIDDKSLPGNTLGSRRLHIESKKLYKLRKTIVDLGSFVLYTKIYSTFIDCNGKLFKYKSVRKVPLIYRKILEKVSYKNGTMLIIENTHCPMWYYREVSGEKEYAALLVLDRGYILLGLTEYPSERSSFKI